MPCLIERGADNNFPDGIQSGSLAALKRRRCQTGSTSRKDAASEKAHEKPGQISQSLQDAK
jgi:hypothetical protein